MPTAPAPRRRPVTGQAGSNPRGSELVAAACRKFPHLPSRTLARALCKEHPHVWPRVETCRQSVLYYRGRRMGGGGKSERRYIAATERARSTCPRVPWNPEALPASHAKPFLPFEVEVARDARALVLGDLHVPYHDIPAARAALMEGRREEVTHVLLNGDTLDFAALSKWDKNPETRDPVEEIAKARQLLDAIDDLFPKARKIWKDGNHDERYPIFIMRRAPELYALIAEHAALPRLLELDDRGWEYVTDKRPIYLGKLPLIHGHEYPTPVIGPVNAARGLFLRAKAGAMVNHHHQTSEHTEPTIKGEMITAWSLGCLCDLHPRYAPFNKWNHGAAIVHLARGGDYRVRNFRIHCGRVLN